MKHTLQITVALMVLSTSAQAACYADYKAKRDDPLRLHYGVAEITGDCTIEAAEGELSTRLGENGWQLLRIEGVFDDTGLEGKEDSAGEYYLRY